METHSPKDKGISSSLWGRLAVHQLLMQKFNIDMPVRSINNYLKRWRMSLQRPRRKNYKQDKVKIEEFKIKLILK